MNTSSMMSLIHRFDDPCNWHAELYGKNVTLWDDIGRVRYDGSIEGLTDNWQGILNRLIALNFIKPV